jgi:UDP-2,3-diacylglucosamine hydrolase
MAIVIFLSDFFIGKDFKTQSGCKLLPEEYVLTINGKRILLMHGDTLCENDVAYQRARKWLRNPFLQWLFLRLPLVIRRRYALRIRQKSAQYTHSQTLTAMDVTQQAVLRVMRKHEADILIHGHTHLPTTHMFTLDGKGVERIVLPAWHNGAYALALEGDATISQLPIF